MLLAQLFRLLFLFSLLSLLPSFCLSSSGDRDPHFRACVSHCSNFCDRPASSNSPLPHDPSLLFQTLPEPLSPILKMMGWTCSEDCRYRCMRLHHAIYDEQGLEPHKYYGKWPFVRVLGIQEICSVIFSIANAIPHIFYSLKYIQMPEIRSYSLRSYWIAYAIFAINTWIWSTAFHARDFVTTERLDYFSASLTIAYACSVALIRIFHVSNKKNRMTIVALMMIGFAIHVSYLQFVHFDYGWNMFVSMSLGLAYSLFWLVFAIQTNRPYCSYLKRSVIGLVSAAMLEIFDFSPIYDLLDAHAVWHGVTPILCVWFWKFIIEDSKFESQKEKRKYSNSI